MLVNVVIPSASMGVGFVLMIIAVVLTSKAAKLQRQWNIKQRQHLSQEEKVC